MQHFRTDYVYVDRETKAQYVWLKYQPILRGNGILDVGADECYLKQYLDDEASYWGIGLRGHPDQQVDLEKEKIPFPDNSFDCVLCLDVLEHLNNIHEIFDELCRVSRRWVIVSLPNPWRSFWSCLRSGDYYPGRPMKFYGLPLEPPEDRHKWFFSSEAAEKFIIYRAAKNRMRVVQMDNYGMGNEGRGWKRLVRTLAMAILFRNTARLHNLNAGTLWVVLGKETDGDSIG